MSATYATNPTLKKAIEYHLKSQGNRTLEENALGCYIHALNSRNLTNKEECTALVNAAHLLSTFRLWKQALIYARILPNLLKAEEPDFQLEVRKILSTVFLKAGSFWECYSIRSELKENYPNDPEVLHNFAIIEYMFRNSQKSLLQYNKALKLMEKVGQKPSAEFLLDKAMCMLDNKYYTEGFQEYEVRWEVLPKTPIWNLVPKYIGQSEAHDKTLLVHQDMGFGDTFQFIRYIRLLRKERKIGQVIFSTHPSLVSLLSLNSEQLGIDEVVGLEPQSGVHYHVPLLSLMPILVPWINDPNFGKHDVYIQAPTPDHPEYVKLPPGRSNRKYKIGIVWSGNPINHADFFRSIPLEDMASISFLDVQLYSLQIGDAVQEIYKNNLSGIIIDCSPLITSWLKTAALIDQLDFIVSADTSVLHLAGAMGKPCIGIHSRRPCWRWPAASYKGNGYPWYPNMGAAARQQSENQINYWSFIARDVNDFIKAFEEASPEPV